MHLSALEETIAQRPYLTFVEILVLDDNLLDRKRLMRAVSKVPGAYNFTEVDCLADFKVQLKSKTFDLIFVDYALTDGEGLSAVHLAEASDTNNDALRVMVTGYDSADLETKALNVGFDDYLSKQSVDHETLVYLLEAAVKRSSGEASLPYADRLTDTALGYVAESTADIEDPNIRRLVRAGMPEEDSEPFVALFRAEPPGNYST